MVLIPLDHFLHGGLVVLHQQVHVGAVAEEAVGFSRARRQEVGDRAHHAHAGHLVDDEEAFLVRHPIPFLGVGIMAGAEAVGVQPLHALIIPLGHGVAETPAKDIRILVLAKALQVNRLAVDQNPFLFDGDGADADLGVVPIHGLISLFQENGQAIEISVPHLPQMGLLHRQFSFAAFPGGNERALPVPQFHTNSIFPFGSHEIIHESAAIL